MNTEVAECTNVQHNHQELPGWRRYLTGFHHRVVRRMAGMVPERQLGRKWVYPPIWTAMAMVGLDEIGVYIARRQNTVAQNIATRPIMDLCLAAERRPGM